MQTLKCKMDKQQGPAVQRSELYSMFHDKPYRKEYEKSEYV